MKKSKVLAVLSYLNVLAVFPLFMSKDDHFVKTHLKQGLFLSMAFILLPFVLIIPLLGWVIGAVWFALLVVLWLIAIISAIIHREKPIPLFGKVLAKITI